VVETSKSKGRDGRAVGSTSIGVSSFFLRAEFFS